MDASSGSANAANLVQQVAACFEDGRFLGGREAELLESCTRLVVAGKHMCVPVSALDALQGVKAMR